MNVTQLPVNDQTPYIDKYHGAPASPWFYAGWMAETLRKSLSLGEEFVTLNPSAVLVLQQLVLDYKTVVDARNLPAPIPCKHARRPLDTSS